MHVQTYGMTEIQRRIYEMTRKTPSKSYLYKVCKQENIPFKQTGKNGRIASPVLNIQTGESLSIKDVVKQAHGGDSNQTLEEIYEKVCNTIDKHYGKSYIYQILVKENLKFKKLKGGKPKTVSTQETNTQETNTQELEDYIPADENAVEEVLQTMNNNDNENISEEENTIRQRVLEVLNEKCKELKCNTIYDYTTYNYEYTLKMLQYLASEGTRLQETRLNQKDVTQAFQEDVLHEIEFSEIKPGDTTLQTKLKIIREYRRYFEHDWEDLQILQEFLESIDMDKLNTTLNKLKQKQNLRDTRYFYIPRIDNTLIERYDWAKQGQPSSPIVTKPILRTAQILKRKKLHTYIITCEVSGYGVGAYKPWKRVIRCETEQQALDSALSVLNNTKNQKRGNYMWTELNIVEQKEGDTNAN